MIQPDGSHVCITDGCAHDLSDRPNNTRYCRDCAAERNLAKSRRTQRALRESGGRKSRRVPTTFQSDGQGYSMRDVALIMIEYNEAEAARDGGLA